MRGTIKNAILILILYIFAGCENKSMNGIEDGLTVIGIIIAIMTGAYYLVKKNMDQYEKK